MSLCVGKVPVEVRSDEIIFPGDEFVDESKNISSKRFEKGCSKTSTRREQTENSFIALSKHFCKSSDPSSRRQQLELNVSNMEIEESLSEDKHKEMLYEYNQMENILESCLYFVDAMRLETKTSSRLRRQIHVFFQMEDSGNPRVSDEEVSFEFGCKVKAQIYSLLEKNAIVGDLLSELDNRTDDFKTASRNFRVLLKSVELNEKQLDRLQKQYEKIVSNYRHTRWTIDQKVPDLIGKRKCGLVKCLKILGEDLEKLGDERVKVMEFFRSVEPPPRCTHSLVLNKQISDSDLVSRSKRNVGFALKSCSCIE